MYLWLRVCVCVLCLCVPMRIDGCRFFSFLPMLSGAHPAALWTGSRPLAGEGRAKSQGACSGLAAGAAVCFDSLT